MPKAPSNLKNHVFQSEHGKLALDILEWYVPLVLQLPKLRDDPQFMKEKIKSQSASGLTDVATQADIHVQERIKEEILKSHPDWQFWGEEGHDNTFSYDSNKTILVVADPIEGTNNFKQRKDNLWGSVLGLVDMKTKKPIVGIVAHPKKRIFYLGVNRIGAFELKYNGNGELAAFTSMKTYPEFGEFTYNSSPHFEKKLVAEVDKFRSLGKGQPLSENADKLEHSRRTAHIKRNGKSAVFVNPESGALEVVRNRGTIYFNTSNEMAAVFPIIQALGGKITDGNGRQWSFGIKTLIAARTEKDYDFLKSICDQVTKT